MTGIPILDVDQAAAVMRCAPSTVREWARDGRLPGLKPGEDWIFPTEAFYACLNQLAVDAAAARAKPAQPAATLHDLNAAGKAGTSPNRRRRPPAVLPVLPGASAP